MEPDLSFLTPESARILSLFAKHGHDFEQLLSAHPEITGKDVQRVTEELLASGLYDDLLAPAPKKGKGRKSGASREYQLKITLRGSRPPIWRRVVVPGAIMLGELHDVIQVAMGWEDAHLHVFVIGEERFGRANEDDQGWGLDELDENEFRLCDVIDREKTKFRYEYDFGDSWDHQIVVEKIIDDRKRNVARSFALQAKGRARLKTPAGSGDITGCWKHLSIRNTIVTKTRRSGWARSLIRGHSTSMT